MTGLFFAWIWLGGMFAMPSRKIGFMERVLWPMTLGEYLHRIARRGRETEGE